MTTRHDNYLASASAPQPGYGSGECLGTCSVFWHGSETWASFASYMRARSGGGRVLGVWNWRNLGWELCRVSGTRCSFGCSLSISAQISVGTLRGDSWSTVTTIHWRDSIFPMRWIFLKTQGTREAVCQSQVGPGQCWGLDLLNEPHNGCRLGLWSGFEKPGPQASGQKWFKNKLSGRGVATALSWSSLFHSLFLHPSSSSSLSPSTFPLCRTPIGQTTCCCWRLGPDRRMWLDGRVVNLRAQKVLNPGGRGWRGHTPS